MLGSAGHGDCFEARAPWLQLFFSTSLLVLYPHLPVPYIFGTGGLVTWYIGLPGSLGNWKIRVRYRCFYISPMENTVFFSKCIVLCVRSVVLQKYFMYIYIYDIRTIYIYTCALWFFWGWKLAKCKLNNVDLVTKRHLDNRDTPPDSKVLVIASRPKWFTLAGAWGGDNMWQVDSFEALLKCI